MAAAETAKDLEQGDGHGDNLQQAVETPVAADGESTIIRLNALLSSIMDDPKSDLGQQVRGCVMRGEDVPKKLIYTALKQALDNVDTSKPVLITDRLLSLKVEQSPEVEEGCQTVTRVIVKNEDEYSDSGDPFPEELATQEPNEVSEPADGTIPNGAGPHRGAAKADVQVQVDKGGTQRAFTANLWALLKKAFCPPEEQPMQPVRAESETEESKKVNPVVHYFKKMRGGQKRPKYDRQLEALLSFIGSFIGIFILTTVDYFCLQDTPYTMVIGSFGASAVLVYCAIKSPLAQPRNVIFGHLIAGVVGPACQMFLGKDYPWLAAALAVALSIAFMSLTNTVHPPAGATALIAVYSNDKIHALGFMYALVPVGVGAVILVLVAVIVNNLFHTRRYPQHWF